MKRMGFLVVVGLGFAACGPTPEQEDVYPLLARPPASRAHLHLKGTPQPAPGLSDVQRFSTPPDLNVCPDFPGGPPLSYGGGAVIANVNVVPVFWGSNVNAATKATIPGFLSTLVNSSYMDWLTEYSTTLPITGFPTFRGTNQIIGRGTATKAYPIKPIDTKTSLTDADIGTELTKQLSAGDLPAAVTDTTLYMIYMPKGVSVTQPNGDVSCSSAGDVNCFCGYHSGASAAIHYGVVMDQSVCPLSFSGATQIEATEMDSSHEIIEAVTDPDGSSWTTSEIVALANPNCSELADICNDEAVFLPASSTAIVSAIWSQRTNSCVTNVSIPAAGDPSSYSRVEFNPGKATMAVSAVNYLGPGNGAKELSLNSVADSTWILKNLSSVAKPQAPVAASHLATYARSDGVNSVVYRVASGDIYELQLVPGASSWKAVDLMETDTSPPPAPATGNPGAYARSDGYNSVVYRGTDSHVHELAWTPSTAVSTTFVFGDLTKASGAPADAAGDPFGYIRADGVNAVVYRSSDNHIRELSLNGTTWSWGDLSVASGNAPAASSRPRGYARSDQVSAVVYQGIDNQIYELSLGAGPTQWQVNNLTNVAGAPSAASEPAPFVRTYGSNTVVYRDTNNHIEALTLNERAGWVVSDLTKGTGAPAATGAPTGYVRADGVNAVNFHASSNNDIIELYNIGSGWGWGNLTAVSGGSL